MYLFVAFVILLVWGYCSHASRRYMRDSVSNISGPYCIPLLGAVHTAYGFTPKNIIKTANYLLAQSETSPTIRVWAGNRLFVASADFELSEQLLSSNTHITKQRTYNILAQWLGYGLLLSDGKKWHSRRKIITPTFHFKILEQFLNVFDQQSTILIECLEKKANGQEAFDIHPFISALALDAIAETAMGTKVNAQTDDSMQYTSAVHE